VEHLCEKLKHTGKQQLFLKRVQDIFIVTFGMKKHRNWTRIHLSSTHVCRAPGFAHAFKCWL